MCYFFYLFDDFCYCCVEVVDYDCVCFGYCGWDWDWVGFYYQQWFFGQDCVEWYDDGIGNW